MTRFSARKTSSLKAIVTLCSLIMAAGMSQPTFAHGPVRPVVIGYIPTFKGSISTHLDAIDLSQLTHINLAFANPNSDGVFRQNDQMTCMDTHGGPAVTSEDILALVARAHAAHVQVLLSLGGGRLPPCSGDWVGLLAANRRATLVANLMQMVDSLGLDGLDIDLEWETLTRLDMASEYTPFIAELHKALKARSKSLTCATASQPGGMIPTNSIPDFTYINIMAYDNIGATWGTAGDEQSSLGQARADMKTWLDRGAKPSQIVLGVPFYGYGFNGYNIGYDYKDILASFGATAAESDIVGHRCPGCAYITYNGRPTLRAKAQLAKTTGAGIMIWELTGDAPGPDSLLQLINESLKP